MRRIILTMIVAILSLSFAGCHSAPPPAPVVPAVPAARSLADMKAEYAVMRKQYEADCLTGTPEHIKQDQAICETERQKMAPLGNAIAEAEVKAAQRQTNP